MSVTRNRSVFGIVAALVGAAAAIGIEIATHWSPIGHLSSVPAMATCAALRHPSGANIEICVVPVPISAADDFLRSVLAALVGGVLGVGTFIVGQVSVNSRERRTDQVAVTVVRKELQANRAAMNNALNPIPGTTPTERIRISIFPLVRIQLAARLPYALFTRTFLLYERLGELENYNLRDIASETVLRLRDDTEALDTDLSAHDLSPHRKES